MYAKKEQSGTKEKAILYNEKRHAGVFFVTMHASLM